MDPREMNSCNREEDTDLPYKPFEGEGSGVCSKISAIAVDESQEIRYNILNSDAMRCN